MNPNFALKKIVLALLLPLLGACGHEYTPDRAYYNCMKKNMKAMEKRSRRYGPSENVNDSRENMADEICREILYVCEEDIEGYQCSQLMKRYKRI